MAEIDVCSSWISPSFQGPSKDPPEPAGSRSWRSESAKSGVREHFRPVGGECAALHLRQLNTRDMLKFASEGVDWLEVQRRMTSGTVDAYHKAPQVGARSRHFLSSVILTA